MATIFPHRLFIFTKVPGKHGGAIEARHGSDAVLRLTIYGSLDPIGELERRNAVKAAIASHRDDLAALGYGPQTMVLTDRVIPKDAPTAGWQVGDSAPAMTVA